METTIHSILDELRDDARNNRDMGDKFERLMQAFLRKDPYYADLFSEVWMWMEWPDRGKRPDTGIDLVAQERATGDYWAIQCKFFDPDTILQKSDIDSFFTASGKKPFAHRLIVSTTKNWSTHALEARNDQHIPVSTIDVNDLAESAIDWSEFSFKKPRNIRLRPKKKLREHQKEAHANVIKGFKASDRGKLIMACGTGKTFTALKIAETAVPDGGTVLFLVPSISLISQTLTEWSNESGKPIHCFAVCSDPKVGQNQTEDISTSDLAYPAHTNAKELARQFTGMKRIEKSGLFAIFSTYQSIAVIANAQKHGLPGIDLIICDEAHRTTGVEEDSDNASAFIKVHDPKFLKARKRLYMTATPRIYDDTSKSKAKEADIDIYSMDDESTYGPEFHRLDFSEAVRRDLLADYKVMVLAVDEKHVSAALQSQLADQNREFTLPDAVKIIGCWNGLNKRMVEVVGDNTPVVDPTPMRRGVAFSQTIKASKAFTSIFDGIIKEYQLATRGESSQPDDFLKCEVAHVDGTMNAMTRNDKLRWLKEESTGDGKVCRLLSNARCLSEGVDVPALDAVMFLNPRNSVVDVVQSVGRVMRKAPGKHFGYIILPIGIPADIPPEEALSDNQKYKVVWQVLQALRAHDDRFNAIINKLDLNKGRPPQIQVIGVGGGRDTDTGGAGDSATREGGGSRITQIDFTFPQIENWRDAIFAKIVVKCGTRKHWETWAKDVATIAERHITRIKALLESKDKTQAKAFSEFLAGLRNNLNPAVSVDDAIEMLAQHLVTRPVFDALFENYKFTQENPVSQAMQKMLDSLKDEAMEKEAATLEKFYASVREKASGIDNLEGRQRVIVELYDKFFRSAFPRMAERLGIVYTPVEVVDFIVRSVEDVLRDEFDSTLGAENVHIIDPFTGTGTFIVRLLQSGLIPQKDLLRKYTEELHANEIVLLAYYIAAINIEETYHGLMRAEGTETAYEPFKGIVLTDTFQLFESSAHMTGEGLPENSDRVKRQQAAPIRVVMSNPPYSAQQESENDNNANLEYSALDDRIRSTYAEKSNAKLLKNLYDSYVRAIRWATDRISGRGVVAFVTNGSFIDANNMDGLRGCLADEFTSLYVFNLRGNARTQGEQRRMEAGSVFGAGSRTPVAITIMVKNPDKAGPAVLHYHDIGDYLSQEEKLAIVADTASIGGLAKSSKWQTLAPNAEHDWINQRDPAFEAFVPLGDKERGSPLVYFDLYSQGLLTSRDSWCYNASRKVVATNMRRMVETYMEDLPQVRRALEGIKKEDRDRVVAETITSDAKRISWSRALKGDVSRAKPQKFKENTLAKGTYRPFVKQWVCFDRSLNEFVYQLPQVFPEGRLPNIAIMVTGGGASKPFTAIATDILPNYHFLDTGQCFPFYAYSPADESAELNFGEAETIDGYRRRSAITNSILSKFQAAYDTSITKEDIFYYVYGILHSPEYRTRFAADLKKMLPRIPFAGDFWAFSKAGRSLAELHLNYEKAPPYPVQQHCDELAIDPPTLFRVEKMYFGKRDKKPDKSTIIYNSRITLTGIPLEAYEYVVNGKPAIEWIMERYQLTKDKDSGIVNDPNDWASEHNDPEYILRLLKSIITVSIETMKIVKALPPLNERTEMAK